MCNFYHFVYFHFETYTLSIDIMKELAGYQY